MKRKVRKTSVVIIGFLLLLSGCVKTAGEEVTKPLESAKIQIGFTLDSKVLERWIRDVDVFVSTAHQMGAEVDVQVANGDLNTQIEQIDHFIEAQMDVLVVVAVDCKGLQEPLERARRAGIKIISYDRLIEDVPSDLYISFDNYQVGRLMGETMAAKVAAEGRVMMICGPKSDGNATQVEQGFLDVIADTDLEVVSVDYADGWLAEYAFQTVNRAFLGVSSVDGVMCGNDGLAVQAIKALAERRLAGAVCVVGQDADVEACQKIVEGMQTMTVYKNVDQLAREAAEYAVMLAQDIPLEIEATVTSGDYQVPQKLLEPIAVTKENIDQVIVAGGFHMREDVYMNVE